MATKKKWLHSLDIALDRSDTDTAYAINAEGHMFIKVHAFNYRNNDHYVYYNVTETEKTDRSTSYTTQGDEIGDRDQLVKWLVRNGHRKTREGAENLLRLLIWKPAHESYLLAGDDD